jgi:crotonobetainyl-CoA:carnitine CoA-transferase CaiB-like acyl-CoA transferase
MLSPYRVLDLTNERGQLCGQVLGDMGADVILVEPPGGSTSRRIGPFVDDVPDLERSLFFWSTNRNKRSITLDLKTQDGRDLFRRLAVKTDFLVESFEPGYLDSIGLGFEALSGLNPGLILTSITPFGQSGPKAHWPASDLTVLASTGALLLTGDDDRPPVRVAVPQAFFHASAEAAVGALMALHARNQDGLGQNVDVSAQAATMMATQSFVLAAQWGDFELRRSSGGLKLGPLNLRFVHPASDGYVSVTFLFGTAIGPFSRRLMEQMYAEGFVDEATRDKDWLNYTVLLLTGQEPPSELDRCCDAIAAWCRAHTKRELFAMALEQNLLLVPVNTTADVVESPQLAARDFWREVDQPQVGSPVTYAGPFAKFSETPITYRRPPPLIGQHNAAVFAELGLDEAARRALFAQGVI